VDSGLLAALISAVEHQDQVVQVIAVGVSVVAVVGVWLMESRWWL